MEKSDKDISKSTIVVLVNGEVLADGQGSTILDQRRNARDLAEGLRPILSSDRKIAVLHGNKIQIGFVLFRAELASHVLHTIPLDVCGADTQGATGYMLSQAFMNALNKENKHRRVICMITQTLVDSSVPIEDLPKKAIGPWYDRDKADQYRQARNWEMLEDPGRGYRRGVPSLPAKEILEMDGIRQMVEAGDIVIAGGGGGIPVMRNRQGDLEGIEAVVESEQVACLMAQQLAAGIMLMIVNRDEKFIRAGLSIEKARHMSIAELDGILKDGKFSSSTVYRHLMAASEFLHKGGEGVVITTLGKLADTIAGRSGLRIGAEGLPIDLTAAG